MTEEIVIGKAMVDWLRLTSFESIIDRLPPLEPDEKRVIKRLNYRGHKYDGVFIGAGLQAKRAHFMLEVTGGKSDGVWGRMPTGLHCTRIDLQVTLPQKWTSIHSAGRELRMVPWSGPQRGIRTITNDDHQDTCYIGSRRSAIYIRVYAKGDPDNQHVRFEVEFKREYADGVWQSLHEGVTPAEMLAAEIWRLPQVPALRPFHEWASEWEMSERAPVRKIETRRKWVEGTLIPALWKMATSHEGHDWLLSELTRLVQYMNSPKSIED